MTDRIWHTVAQRWFTPEEKALFMAGYKRGYQSGANGNRFPEESWERYLKSDWYGLEEDYER